MVPVGLKPPNGEVGVEPLSGTDGAGLDGGAGAVLPGVGGAGFEPVDGIGGGAVLFPNPPEGTDGGVGLAPYDGVGGGALFMVGGGTDGENGCFVGGAPDVDLS